MNILRPGMGTEASSQLLSVLICMARPKVVVEIGAGNSTILIATALRQAQSEWRRDRDLIDSAVWEERTALLDPARIPESYQPRLITIDNFQAEGSSAEEAWNTLRSGGIEERFVTFVEGNFFALEDETIKSWGPIDLAWIDAGTPADDVRFVSMLWEQIVPGGYLCLHEPNMTAVVSVDGFSRVRKVRSPVWEEISYRLDGSFELITLPENHKYRQSGLGIVRKREALERVVRSQSLQAELVKLGESPIRNDVLQLGIESLRQRDHRNSVVSAMSSPDARAVYAAIVLGARRISDVLCKVDVDVKAVNKIVARLQSIGLVKLDGDGLSIVESIWAEAERLNRREGINLGDRDIESDDVARLVAKSFDFGVLYREFDVSAICKLFTVDHARLRRYLVDCGILQRIDNNYTRVR